MNFHDELKKRTEYAESVINAFLPGEDAFASAAAGAMRYSMTAGGKRLRPILLHEAYRMYGGKETCVEAFMAAMEMIHTHSLIHDDLPALDNDDYRRGRLTVHKVYGEAMGVLSGVMLLNYAYEVMLRAASQCEDPGSALKAMRIMAEKTGLYGMLGGQSVDVENDGKEIGTSLLEYIYTHKTACLFEASLMAGAALAGAQDAEIEKMRLAGHYMGLAFQIQDDILDVEGEEKELGKPLHSDEKNHKVTYVTLFGIKEAGNKSEELTRKAVEILSDGAYDSSFLCGLIRSLTSRRK